MDYKKQSLIVVSLVIIVSVIIFVILNRDLVSTNQQLPIVEEQSLNKQTYQSSATYMVPRGTETIDVEVTLEDKKIINVNVRHSGFDRHSVEYQRGFDNSYKSKVIGQNIDQLNLDVIAGASDTTFGFIKALENIESQI